MTVPDAPVVLLQVDVSDLALGGYIDLLWDVAVFVVVFAALYLVGRKVVVPLAERAFATRRIQETIASALVRIVHVAVFLAALRLALDTADYGYLLSIPPTVIAALTVAAGFASRDIAANLVGGVFIVTDPKFNIGDWIRWQDKEGVIEDISFRVTRVRTFDNELLTVPNSQLATNAVVNAVAKSPRRISHTFHVADDADLGEVASLLVAEAKAHDDVLDRPTPTVRVVNLDNGRAGVQARYWIDKPSREAFVTIRSEYLQRVNRRLNEAGIELPQNW
ncbi:mechanosensitive ion channel family protein [Halorussus rarus]|uniref:mechanosensitive ion channel family protein n=1 Tax=Halorussus TaxID=1070314 RepID=UPI0013B3EF8C|nr:mechanosensitive ion channel family protein [Halorussus rarus]NHN60802.1 mechanosensitive ion channel family protein [Halorussus sp. JP-T4]